MIGRIIHSTDYAVLSLNMFTSTTIECKFKDYAKFDGNVIIVDYKKLENDLDGWDYGKFKFTKETNKKKDYAILMVIDKKNAYLEFPNKEKFPNDKYLKKNKFVSDQYEYNILTIDEYIIKSIIE